MTEFFDFLKHKYAYVAIGEFKPGKFAEAQKLFEKAVSTYKQGFQGACLLQEPGTDRGIAIIYWDNIGDMEANRNEVHEAVLEQMNPLFLKTPLTTFYEVCSEIGANQVQKV
jgi:hypothetical protein